MGFYGDNDLPLGSFLDTFCFSPDRCPNDCGKGMVHHLKRFCHSNLGITMMVENLKESAVPHLSEDEIAMWKFCVTCKIVTPFGPITNDTYNFSFAMFLMLLFHEHKLTRRGRSAEICKHPLGRGHATCFAKGRTLVTFCTQSIILHNLVLPPRNILIPEIEPSRTISAKVFRTMINFFI